MEEIEKIPVNIGVYINECGKNISFNIIRNYFDKMNKIEQIHKGLNGGRWSLNLTRAYHGRDQV